MGNCNCGSTDVPQRTGLRIAGGILTLSSLILFGCAGAVYSALINVKLGAWWGGVLAIIVGVLGLWAANRGVTISITVLGSFAVIVAVIGTIVDGIAAAVIGDLASCLDIKSGEVYGDTDVIYAAAISGCLSSYYYNPNELSCICVDRSISSCYDYELADPNGTCEIIFTSYITNLKASTAFGAIVTILSFVISVIACVDGCSTASSQVHDGSVVLQQVPTIVIAQDIHQKPQAAVVYATAA